MADREDMIRKVQALWAKADDPAAFPAEKEAAIAKARDLMARFQIDEMVLSEASGVKEAVVLSDILIFVEEEDKAHVADQRIMLAHFVGVNNRCKCVIRRMPASVATDGSPIRGGTYLTVVGFKSDVDMVRDLYSNLAMDMLTAMFAEPVSHMTQKQQGNYFANFCDGFAVRVDDRLREIKRHVEIIAKEEGTGSMALVLVGRDVAVKEQFDDMFPNLSSQKMARITLDPAAQARGAAAADNSDLGQKRMGGGTRGAIEA